MRVVLVLLALVALIQGFKYDGLKVKFGPGKSAEEAKAGKYFISLPRTPALAANSYTKQNDKIDGFDAYCTSDHTVCGLYDDKFIVGLQVAVPKTQIKTELKPETYFDSWTVDSKEYYTAKQYYIFKGSLDPADSTVSETGETLQKNGVWVKGLDKKPMKIPRKVQELNVDFKKQGCVDNMGIHYYYKMSTSLECDEMMLPWFPVYDIEGQLVGVGFQTFGEKPTGDNIFEDIPKERDAQKAAIPDAPECFKDKTATSGRLSIHVYYMENPWEITCPKAPEHKKEEPTEKPKPEETSKSPETKTTTEKAANSSEKYQNNIFLLTALTFLLKQLL